MRKKTFIMTEEHLKLLKRMYVSWDDCEFGAPSIDCKRPYGNSSVHQDILEILGLKQLKEGVFEFTLQKITWLLKGEDRYNIYLTGADEESLIQALDKLHKETEIALQIVLVTSKFETGTYETEQYKKDWKKVKN